MVFHNGFGERLQSGTSDIDQIVVIKMLMLFLGHQLPVVQVLGQMLPGTAVPPAVQEDAGKPRATGVQAAVFAFPSWSQVDLQALQDGDAAFGGLPSILA